MYNDASILEIIGRIVMAGFFLVTVALNANKTQLKSHVDRMVAGHAPYPTFVFWFGIVMESVGAVLVLADWHADIGAILLIIFTVLATAIFLRFWQQRDPMRKVMMRNGFLSNVAIVGGLLMLLARVL
jgi:uncharacterized membrane protein YphA (DoxX/SURF4 family)